jgi:hypothetical protein
MWKLIITQKRRSEFTGNIVTENTEFMGKDINELTMLIVRLTKLSEDIETSYKLEKAGALNE